MVALSRPMAIGQQPDRPLSAGEAGFFIRPPSLSPFRESLRSRASEIRCLR